MKPSLGQGLTGVSSMVVTEAMAPRAWADQFAGFADFPATLATAALVGFVEQAAMELLAGHLDPGEFSVGVDLELTHTIASPIGATVTAELQVLSVEPRSVLVAVTVSDDEAVISVGQHRRAILNRDRFEQRLAEKAERLRH
ncbi:MAG: hypothetical protein LBL55_09060 [Propionibacteriaceae bacterium]|jgi:fluoroacetyl-CoA thioesterase|nr:hypothetical protein [Propionibacteriaceae bacterium]